MSDKTLRDAAERLRRVSGSDSEEPWSAYAHATRPDVALAFAAWLDSAARDHEIRFAHAMCDQRALTVARLVLGDDE